MKRLADLGEFGLIDRIERSARRLPNPGGVALGIGDDAAVFRVRRGEDLVASNDAFVEDVHFRWKNFAPATIGRRALAAALSDLAAMGARPLGFLLALAAPGSLALTRLDGIVRGLCDEARRHGCPLAGGNVTSARETSLTSTVIGAVPRGRQLERAGARAGDRILVTGTLGGVALEGLRVRRRGGRVRRVPTPRLAEARRLARLRGIGGCIDISDGLEADLGHLLAAAAGGPLGAELAIERIPRPRGFDAACARERVDPESILMGGGEDYELLFTARPGAPAARALSRRIGAPVTEIGRVTRDRRPRGSGGGWRHF